MFTGIIEDLGTVSQIERAATGARLTITAPWDLSHDKIGDSIAVNGICLTVTDKTPQNFSVDVSAESISRTNFDKMKTGDRVNLERALRLSDRLGGHLVLGHVDGVGTVKRRTRKGNSAIFEISAPKELERYLVEKGSIAIDGISLTINTCQASDFSVNIIPHTLEVTTLGDRQTGSNVNLETDILGKYVEKLMLGKSDSEKSKDMDLGFLAEHGFLKGR